MPIATRKPDIDAPILPELPQTSPETYLGIVADNNDTPTSSLVGYLEGMPWSVDYYGQLIGKHNDLRELDPGQNAAFQQYQKTKQLELRVGTPLASSFDAETGLSTVTGSAIITYILPNVNDYFVADAGTREYGLYRITSRERKVFNRDSVYEISYTLVSYITDETPLYVDLKSKVVREYQFSKERLIENLSPIMTNEVYASSVQLGRSYRDILQRYFRTFFNMTYSTLVVPAQPVAIYDSWLVDFLTQITESSDVPEGRVLRSISMDHERYLAHGSFWQVLLDRRYEDLSRAFTEVCFAPKQHFNLSSWIKGPAFWNIAYFVYPKNANDEAAILGDPKVEDYDLINYVGNAVMEAVPALATNCYPTQDGNLLLIKSVLADRYYVLSEAFYTGGVNLSVLEILIRDYLKCQTIDLAMLTALVNAYPSWPVLERFYYGPLLVLLIKESIKGFY